MELDYLGGGRLNKAVFDVNKDGVVNDADIVAFTRRSMRRVCASTRSRRRRRWCVASAAMAAWRTST